MEHKILLLFVAVIAGCMDTAYATNVDSNTATRPKPATLSPTTAAGSCPAPTAELLECMRQWVCQYLIRLDLRCLLNLNGLPLVGGILGGAGNPSTGSGVGAIGSGGLLGGSGGGLLGGPTGVLGSLLG